MAFATVIGPPPGNVATMRPGIAGPPRSGSSATSTTTAAAWPAASYAHPGPRRNANPPPERATAATTRTSGRQAPANKRPTADRRVGT